jgi:prophage antirepressor-like protein
MSDLLKLVTISNGEARTTTLAIAERTNNQHKNIMELVRRYQSDLEEFGQVAFETRPFETAGGVQRREIARLNEHQAILIISYMRNSEVVRAFKKGLVEAFYAMAMKVQQQKAQVSSAEYLAAVEALVVSTRAIQSQQLENSLKRMNIFEFVGSTIRTIVRDGEPWFVAADVCAVLGIVNNRDAISRLDDYEKGVITTDTLGGRQEMTAINESGVYSLIMTSRKPEAKAFRKWVTSEVLPSIRRTGSYSAQPASTVQQTYAEALIEAGVKQLEIERLELATKQLAQIGYQPRR